MLNREYPADQVAEAISMAMAYNVYSYDGVLNILLQLNTDSPKISHLRPDKIANIPQVNVVPPDLSKYIALLQQGGSGI
jgi:hypothetical protein